MNLSEFQLHIDASEKIFKHKIYALEERTTPCYNNEFYETNGTTAKSIKSLA